MANTDGQIVLGLDIPKTVKQINADIKSLQNQLAQVKATGALDTSATVKKINAQITALQSQLKTIDIKANINTTDAQKAGQKAGQAVADATQKAIDNKNINIDKLNADIKTLVNNLNSFSSKNAGFNSFKTEINGVEVSLDSLISKLSTVDNVTDLGTIRSQAAALKTAFTELAQINEIQLSMDNGHGASEYQNRIQSLINDFQKYGVVAETAKAQTASLQQIFNNMNGMSGQELIAQADKFEQEFKAVKISIDEAKLSYDKLLQPISSSKQVNLTNKIEKWLSNNTRATKSARQELELYLKELSSGSINQEQYVKFSNRLTELDTEMRIMGKLGKSLFQSLSEGAKKFTSWISATAIVMKAITAVRTGIATVRELDTALVDLRKTANMSASELIGFYHSANDTAKQMGVTTQSIIEQAAAWSRLGFNTAEAATQMAKLSSQFQLISPGMTSDEAVSGLVSTMKAYDIEVNDVLDGIMSKVNVIGNNFALSNADIVAMLQDSVSAMAEGNNTLEETIALETAAFEIAQDRSVGNGFKTVALRLRGINEETQEFDDSLKTIQGDLYDLTGVSIMEDADTYKSTYQILKEMSEVWDSLTDKTQAKALELMFGKLRANIGASVLKNFSAAEKAMDDMANSAGNAEAEMSVAMDSIDYKLNKVKETGTGIAQNLFAREDMKSILDIISSLGNGLDWLTEKLGLLGTIVTGVGIFNIFKNVDYLKTPVCPLYI